MGEGRRGFWSGLALGFLFATALRALLSTLFYLSLATLRLNGTAAWALVLLAPLLAPLLPRSRWPVLLAGGAVAALPALRFTDAYVPVAALAAGAGALALVRSPRGGLMGALVGVALNGATLLAGISHDPMIGSWGPLAAVGLAVVALGASPGTNEARRVPAGAAWVCLLAVELAFLASPYALARWTGLAPLEAAVAGVVGLLAGLVLLRRASGGLVVPLATLALVDLAFVRSPLILLSLGALQATLGAAATRLAPPSALSFAPVLGGVLFMLLFFGQPMGDLEWTLVAPLLCAVPLLALLRPAPFPRSRAPSRALALLGLLVVPLAPAPAPVEPHEGEALTVVNWNLHQGFGNRGALDPYVYVDAIREMRPDVLILQESETSRLSSGGLDMPRLLAHELGLRVAVAGPGIAILSRFPPAANETLLAPEAGSAEAALDVHGQTLWVQGVHFARSSVERRAQAEDVLRRVNETEGPRILGGDLNSCPAETCFGGRPSDRIHALLGVVYVDSWTVLHDEGDAAGFTHPAWQPRRRIDVLMVRGLEVLESGPVRDGRTVLGSDHLPMVARVRLPAAAQAST